MILVEQISTNSLLKSGIAFRSEPRVGREILHPRFSHTRASDMIVRCAVKPCVISYLTFFPSKEIESKRLLTPRMGI